ncbi:MAG: hypothetical protein ACE5EF_12315 [Dehalococcoidia bacterium]
MHQLEVWPAVQREESHRCFLAGLQDHADGVVAERPDGQGLADGAGQLAKGGVLQETQDPDVLACALGAQLVLQPAPQHGEAHGQVPSFQGTGEVQGTGLALQQGQVVHGIVLGVLLAPMTPVPGHQSVVHDQADLVDDADNGHRTMGTGDRHGVTVAIEANQGQ